MEFLKTNKYKLGLLLILLTAGVLSFWGAWNEGWSNSYYSAAVKSMLTSWHNFFYVSLDSAGFVSVDKPALGLWVQCLFALIFGVKGWVLILPQALATVVSVALLYKMVANPFGKAAGLLAGLFLAVTPIFIAVGRTNNLDATLILTMMLSVYFLLKSLDQGKLKYLLLSVVFVGLGFNVKMSQALMILPAIFLAYIIFGNAKLGKRIMRLVLATVILVTVALSWCVAVDLTPKDQRPFVGSSSNNSAIDLAVGYNGIMRAIPGMGMSGGMPGMPEGMSGGIPFGNNASGVSVNGNNQNTGNNIIQMMSSGGGPMSSGKASIVRLFDSELGGQIGWMIPLALIGLLAAFINARKKSLTGSIEKRRSLVFWGTAFAVMYLYFSFGGIAHGYYTATIAPVIAAMAALGVFEMWQAYKSDSWVKWLLPAGIAVTSVVQYIILARYSTWNSILPWVVLIAGLLGTSALIASIVIQKLKEKNIQKFVLVLSIAVLVIAPTIWSMTPIMYGSNSVIPSAGPELDSSYKGSSGFGKMFGGGGAGNDIMGSSPALEKFLTNNYKGEKYLIAVSTATIASNMILDTGKAVMAVGGFTASDKILTAENFATIVNKGELKYYLAGGAGPMGGQSDIDSWVKANGTVVPQEKWLDTSSSSGFKGMMGGGQTLYELHTGSNKPAEKPSVTENQSSASGNNPGGGQNQPGPGFGNGNSINVEGTISEYKGELPGGGMPIKPYLLDTGKEKYLLISMMGPDVSGFVNKKAQVKGMSMPADNNLSQGIKDFPSNIIMVQEVTAAK